mgnify:CR=1 FL=1
MTDSKKNHKKPRILRCCELLLGIKILYVTLLIFSTEAMEKQEDWTLIAREILTKIFNELDKGRMPIVELFPFKEVRICHIPINDFITTGMVCKKWRVANLPMRRSRILTISDSKKLISLEDYETIQSSGYKAFFIFSESLIPENVSYLQKFDHITHLALLPPKGTFAYTLEPKKPVETITILPSGITKTTINRLFCMSDTPDKHLKPDVIKNISVLSNLTTLSLSGNNLNSDELSGVLKLTALKQLDLTCNNPGQDFLQEIVCLEQLKKLKLLRVQMDNRKEWTSYFNQALPNCSISLFG